MNTRAPARLRYLKPRHLRTRGQDGDVHKSCSGVSGRLFEGLSVEPLGLFHVDGLHLLGEAHLGVRLGQADQRLQLARVGGDHPPPAADLAHVHVGLRTSSQRVQNWGETSAAVLQKAKVPPFTSMRAWLASSPSLGLMYVRA